MNNFHRILYSNDEIIKQRNTKWYFAVIIFIVSVMLIATPFVSAKLLESPKSLMNQFKGVENGMIQALTDYDCQITNKTLDCQQEFSTYTNGDYQFFINVTQGQELDLPDKYVLFSKEVVTIFTRDGHLQGDYTLLDGTSFNELLELKEEENLDNQTLTGHLLQNINQSTLSTHIPQTYISVFIQYFIYVGLVSLVNMAINANRLKEKISFKQFVTMNILAMFSLALITAIIGLFSPVNATAIFPLLYMARVIMIYFKLLKSNQN